MNNLSKEYIKNNSNICSELLDEEQIIIKEIAIQKKLHAKLISNMEKLAKAAENPVLHPIDKYIETLTNFKKAVELFEANINLLNNFLTAIVTLLLEIKTKKISNKTIRNFNNYLTEITDKVVNNTLQIKEILNSALPYYEFIMTKTNNMSRVKSENIEFNIEAEICENTLIVSELRGCVILPYTLKELKNKLKKSEGRYTSINDLINKEYTLPLELYKNPVVARFREAFNLLKKREKKSIQTAFDLGTELMFNFNLHPAIITACKNIDELDIYLDCLDSNETEMFECFKIKYEFAPKLQKNK